MMDLRLLRPFVVAATLAGCELAPDVGTAQIERCVNVDSDPGTSVSFSRDLYPKVIMPKCVPCHDPNSGAGGSSAGNIGFQVGGLDLTTRDAALAGGVNSAGALVTPGQPCDSLLYQKTGRSPPVGVRMPFDGPPFLTDEERGLVADWIAEGALP
ncbi:MAG: hypothetical protein IV100_08840 [Myxococcales bacterium]|nr:hypothetical protein [Myxococcales bacterium]